MRSCLLNWTSGRKVMSICKLKRMLKIRASYMGALLEKQRNFWENSVNPGVTSKSIIKTITLRRFVILTPNFDSRYYIGSSKYFENIFWVKSVKHTKFTDQNQNLRTSSKTTVFSVFLFKLHKNRLLTTKTVIFNNFIYMDLTIWEVDELIQRLPLKS